VFGNAKPVKDPRACAREALRFVEFSFDEDTPTANLNTGQLKRLDLARSLASSPELLLLDEPGAGLTPAELMSFMDLLRRIRAGGTTIVVVEHLMKVIMGLCDRMAVLRYGEMIALGTPSEISGNDRVIEAYLGEKYVG
jgi:branched-chain amino acid transport system ATP-binding protein